MDESASMQGDRPDILDVIGVGIGPFNLSLAALLAETGQCNALFFERQEQFSWHPGMLLEGTTLQVSFLADLVSLVSPTSRFSFLNYLKEHDRLFQFFFFENFYIPRREYDHYCRWVSGELPGLHFGTEVVDIAATDDGYLVTVDEPFGRRAYHARNIVLGTGTQPWLPECLRELALSRPDQVMHTASYAQNFRHEGKSRVLVLGSGQSAAEVFQQVLERQVDQQEGVRYQVHWFTRSEGFLPMQYSKLSLEYFTPDYTKYFHSLPQEAKDEVVPRQGFLHKGISVKTLGDIYDILYHRSIGGIRPPVRLQKLCELLGADRRQDGRLEAHFLHRPSGKRFSDTADAIIAGTGYRAVLPACLASLQDRIERDAHQRVKIDADFCVAHRGPGRIFMQNGDPHTHGIGAPDLGLGAWRAACIANQLVGRAFYRLPPRVAFQNFGVSDD